jgi:chemotaxis signal transduction protein
MVGHDRLNRQLEEVRALRQNERVEDTEAVLRRRSRVLADRELEPAAPDVYAEVVTVRRAELLLAFPIDSAREVRRVKITGFPGSSSVVNGVFQIRGKVLSLVDLASFGGEETTLQHGEETLVIVVERDERAIGVRIDEVVGPQTIEREEIDGEFHGVALPFIRNVTRNLVHIVDVEALNETPEIVLRKRRTDVGGV